MQIAKVLFSIMILIQGIFGFSQESMAEKIFKKGILFEPQNLTGSLARGDNIYLILDLFEGLLSTAADGSNIPGMAERWEIGEDGKTYTFFLRKNAKWSNGDPVTANDFVYAWRKMASPEKASYWAGLAPIRNAAEVSRGEKPIEELGIQADGDYKLIVTLTAPTTTLAWLAHSCLTPLPQKVIETYGEDKWMLPENIVVNGPFTLETWAPKSQVKFKKNQKYWAADTVKLDGIIFYLDTDYQSQLKKFKAGELHLTSPIPDDQSAQVKELMPKNYRSGPLCMVSFCAFNHTHAPFDNLKIRQALTLAIDRDKLHSGEPAYAFVPSEIDGYIPQEIQCDVDGGSAPCKNLSQAQREDLARKLFAESGYQQTRPLKLISMLVHKKMTEAVSQMWKSVLGLQTEFTDEEKKDSDLTFRRWKADVPYNFLQLFKSDNASGNAPGYHSSAYDEALGYVTYNDTLMKGANSRNQQEKNKHLMSAEKQLLADFAVCPIGRYGENILISDKVTGGFVLNPIAFHPSRWVDVIDE